MSVNTRSHRGLAYLLCFLLVFPVHFVPLSSQGRVSDQPTRPRPEHPFRQLVIYIPDIFDNAKEINKALSRLVAKGIPAQDIINLAQHPDFDPKSGLAVQAAQLARIAEVESAKRRGLKAHLIAKGTGGLVARSYLAESREIRPEGAPIIDVIGIGIPHNGRVWAKWAYALALPLPGVGVRSAAVRDLSPDSRFMRKLNHLKNKREKMVHAAEETLTSLDDLPFNQKLQAKLAAIDQAKAEAAEQADQIFCSPESIKLGPQDMQRINEMKSSCQALKMACEKFDNTLAKETRVKALVILGDDINREQVRIRQKIAEQTRKPADWLERSPLAQKLLKIKDLSRVIETKTDQAQSRLLDLLYSPEFYQLGLVPGHLKNQLLSAITRKIQELEKFFSQDKCEKALNELDRFYARTAPRLRKQWNNFTAMSVTASQDSLGHKPGSRLAQSAIALTRLQTAWDAMEDSREKWLAGLRQYTEAKSNIFLRDRFQAYQKNIELQSQQLEKSAPVDSAEARQRLDKAKQLLTPVLDELFYSLNMPTLTDAVRAGYQAFKLHQKDFLGAVEHSSERFPSRIVKKEYLLYLDRANHLDQLVMNKMSHSIEELQQAIVALKMGSAFKEMEMFAQTSRRRLDRAFEKLYHQIEVPPSFDPLFPHTPDRSDGRVLHEILSKIKQSLSSYKLLRDLDYLKAKSGLLKLHLQKQTQAAERSLAAFDAIRALEKMGHAEQCMKMICARSAGDLNRKVSQTALAAELSQLSQERRNLVIAVLSITGQAFEQTKAFDLTRFAARLEAFGRVPSANPFFWNLAQQQIKLYTESNRALRLYRNLAKLEIAEQAAKDAVWNHLNKAVQLDKARKHIGHAAGASQTMTCLREKSDLLQQTNLRIERLSALQAKTLPLAQYFRLHDWQNLKKQIAAGIAQEKEILFSRQALLTESSAQASAFLPKPWDSPLKHQYNLYSGETLEQIMGHKYTEHFKTLAIKDKQIKQDLQTCIQTVKQAGLLGEIRQELHDLNRTQIRAQHYLKTNLHLLKQQVLVSRLLQQFDKPADEATHMQAALNGPGIDRQQTLQKPDVQKELETSRMDREKIAAALDLINMEISAQLMSAGLKFNAAQVKSIAQRSQARFKTRLLDMDKQSGRECRDALLNINHLAAGAAQDIGDIIKNIHLASFASDISRALARAKDRSNRAAQDLAAGRAPPDWDIAGTRSAKPLQQVYENVVNRAVDFIRQQAIRTQVRQSLDQVAILGDKARTLLDRHILEISDHLAKLIFSETRPAMPLLSTANPALDRLAEQIGLASSQVQILKELDKLHNLKDHFNAGLKRQLLEIRRADAALVMQAIAAKYQTLGEEFQEAFGKITCQLNSGNQTLDPAFNFVNPGQFKLDQELLRTLQQDVFARLVESHPILKELEKPKDVIGLLNNLAAQGGAQFSKWLHRTEAYKHAETLTRLRQEAKNLLDQAVAQGTIELLKSDLGRLMREIGRETKQIETIFSTVTGPLKDMILRSEFMQQLDIFQRLPDLITGQIDSFIGDVQALISNNAFMQSINALGKNVLAIWDQLSGKKSWDLAGMGQKLAAHFSGIAGFGQTAINQVQALIADMGGSHNALGLWAGISEGFSKFGENLAGSLKDFITASCNIDLGAAFMNFTLAPGQFFTKAGDMISGFIADSFEFRFDSSGGWFQADQVWDTVADIFNSENWKFDFFRAADGFMQSISDGISSLVDRGLEWAQNCWQEYLGQAQEYLDIFTGGPSRWLEELTSGKWADSINGLIDKFLPPEFQAAKSTLEKIYFTFDADFDFSADYVFSMLDDLSVYLSDDLRGIYTDISDIYEQGQEYYQRGQEAWDVIQSGDLTSLAVMGSRLLGSLENPGPVYVLGNGSARSKGAYDIHAGQTYQSRMDDYLAQLDPSLHNLPDISGVEADPGVLSGLSNVGADFHVRPGISNVGAVSSVRRGISNVGADFHVHPGISDAAADGDAPLLEKPELSAPRGGIPMPPGKGHWEIDPATGPPSLLSRVKGVFKEGAKTWADPRRWGPKAKKVNEAIIETAPKVGAVLKEAGKTWADPRRWEKKAEKVNKAAGPWAEKTGQVLKSASITKGIQLHKSLPYAKKILSKAARIWVDPRNIKNTATIANKYVLKYTDKLLETRILDGSKIGAGPGGGISCRFTKYFRGKVGIHLFAVIKIEDGKFVADIEEYIGYEFQVANVFFELKIENGVFICDGGLVKGGIKITKDSLSIGGSIFHPAAMAGIEGKLNINILKYFEHRQRKEKHATRNQIPGRKEDD